MSVDLWPAETAAGHRASAWWRGPMVSGAEGVA
ncbi:hypothetical protein A4R44_00883 [Amycolatopsis sp. M39]|nr:hypothetical protein A4R44_00883 [Amycolatopsis sp. M39]